jgi:mRNA interferase RelE/StbE
VTYRIVFTNGALKELKKLDKQTALFIMAWVRKNLNACTDPRRHGKGLTAKHSGQWRYRLGDYRLIAEIRDSERIVLILTVGHRREVYE